MVRGNDHLSNTAQAAARARGARREPAALRAPAAAARPGRQEALQAPRRRVGSGAARRPGTCRRRSTTTSRCSARASPPTRSTSRPTSWPSASDSSACPTNPARVRRAQAAPPQRALHARAGDRRADRPAGGVHRPRRPARRGRDLAPRRSRRSPTSGRSCGFMFDGPADDPKAFAKTIGRRRRRCAALTRRRATRSPRVEPFDAEAIESGAARRRRARGEQARPGVPAGAGRDRGTDGLAGDLRERRAARPRGDAGADRRARCASSRFDQAAR